eukprot:m.105671 g.105671  ORF g.105671 m.105671 type:complete len:150 (+) comp13887_c0_seq1:2640-3089(+)
MSAVTIKFENDEEEYFCVGTAIVIPSEVEPQEGRIIVFKVQDGKLSLISQKKVEGCVYAMHSFHGRLLAGINAKIALYKWEAQIDGSKELTSECTHYGHTLVIMLDTFRDFIVVGDLMSSITLLQFDGKALKDVSIAQQVQFVIIAKIV